MNSLGAVPSDNRREFCGREDRYPYELFQQLEATTHKRTQIRRPQSSGIVARLHRTLLDKHFGVEGRKTWFETIDEMQVVLNTYLIDYNTRRPNRGRGMDGRIPAKAFRDGIRKPSRKEATIELKAAV